MNVDWKRITNGKKTDDDLASLLLLFVKIIYSVMTLITSEKYVGSGWLSRAALLKVPNCHIPIFSLYGPYSLGLLHGQHFLVRQVSYVI